MRCDQQTPLSKSRPATMLYAAESPACEAIISERPQNAALTVLERKSPAVPIRTMLSCATVRSTVNQKNRRFFCTAQCTAEVCPESGRGAVGRPHVGLIAEENGVLDDETRRRNDEDEDHDHLDANLHTHIHHVIHTQHENKNHVPGPAESEH